MIRNIRLTFNDVRAATVLSPLNNGATPISFSRILLACGSNRSSHKSRPISQLSHFTWPPVGSKTPLQR